MRLALGLLGLLQLLLLFALPLFELVIGLGHGGCFLNGLSVHLNTKAFPSRSPANHCPKASWKHEPAGLTAAKSVTQE